MWAQACVLGGCPQNSTPAQFTVEQSQVCVQEQANLLCS
jgi:hypothetical protein